MRILIFHGYLLDGTGSNVYNARLAAALVKLGHEVHLLSQDRHPQRQPFVQAYGDWDSGELILRYREDDTGQGGGARQPACTVYRPALSGLLPVYVEDRYEGIEAKTFAHCTDEQVADYVRANVRAVREVLKLARPEIALANHLVMGPVILARALQGEVPYAVKVHGSALEYTVKPEPERFLGYAREGLAGAGTVLVGSQHTATSLWDALDDPQLEGRTRLGPPGVDIEHFAPRQPAAAQAGLRSLALKLHQSAAAERPRPEDPADSAFARDDRQAAQALGELANGERPLVGFVGKLIVSKGVDLLIAAWPLVLEAVPEARLAVVGFGAYRQALEGLCGCLTRGDLDAARDIARQGRGLEGAVGVQAPLRHLLAFLDSLTTGQAERYRRAACSLERQVVFTGRLDHEELVDLLPACEALVVPSTFPEAFGMVAAEAAACGALPISAGHSGLAEVSAALAQAVGPPAGDWLSYPVDDRAVAAIAERVCGWLSADEATKGPVRKALVATVRERWSWEGVACAVIDAASASAPGR